MEAKKISFGFSKINKKPNVLLTKEKTKTESKMELIKCLEGQIIKLVEEKPEIQPLIIPLKESQKTSAALASIMKRRAVLLGEEEPEDNIDSSLKPSTTTNIEGIEDIEKRAARELLADVQKNNSKDSTNNFVVPVVNPDDLPLDGAKESTLDDYDSVPIQDFGKAMLRGMGWTEPLTKSGKHGAPKDDAPMVRPKGMGLGADKALKKKTLLVAPETNEVMEIKRGACVLILGGKHKDLYGKIEGFDDHAGRVIVKMAIGGAKEAFNEFLCQPVSKKEYAQYGKCINSNKYEEYKRNENEHGQIILEKHEKDFNENSARIMKKERTHFVEDKYQRNSCTEDTKYIKREREQTKNRANDKPFSSVYEKSYSKNETMHHERSKADVREGVIPHSRHHNDRDKREYQMVDEIHRRGKHDDYESKHSRYQMSRKNDDYSNRDKEMHRLHDKETNADSERYSNSHKYEKTKKPILKKKSKKSKKNYRNNSSDADTSTTASDSSSESDEAKYKTHKKKTKKSKRQRERSRSRGRR